MKIKLMILLGFSLITLMVGMVGWFSYSNSKTVGEMFKGVGEETIPTVSALKDLKSSVLRVLSSTMELSLIKAEKSLDDRAPEEANSGEEESSGEETEGDLIEEGKSKFNDAFNRYETLIQLNPSKKELKNEIKKNWEVFIEISEDIISDKENGVYGSEIIEKKEDLEKAEEALLDSIQISLSQEEEELKEKDALVNKTIQSNLNEIRFLLIVSLIFAVLAGTYISFSISRSINILQKGAIEIGKGKLGIKIELDSKNELGDLAKTINKMSSDLAEITISSGQLEKKVKEKTRELDKKNKELEKAMEDFYTVRVSMSNNITKEDLEKENKKIREKIDKIKNKKYL
ncbi:MAG: HAMP domain-containing protein [Patescibacteria group bacterium]|jgi:methyl-accepting chemotaxis protein|nr:HAMP domain-containing protein [Patescibacteria group bacterium]